EAGREGRDRGAPPPHLSDGHEREAEVVLPGTGGGDLQDQEAEHTGEQGPVEIDRLDPIEANVALGSEEDSAVDVDGFGVETVAEAPPGEAVVGEAHEGGEEHDP